MNLYSRIMPPTEFDSLARNGIERFVLSRLHNSNRSSGAAWLMALCCVAGFYMTWVKQDHVLGAIAFIFLAISQIFEHYAGKVYFEILRRAKQTVETRSEK